MSYLTKTENILIGATHYQMRSLLDNQQCPDSFENDSSNSQEQSVNTSNWPLFGLLWPAGLLLAELVDQMPLSGLRILEVGCGLAMSGIVAHRKGADVTVSDYHPAASEFVAHNVALNGMSPMSYKDLNWSKSYPDLGVFDLIIGSDLLYDRSQPKLLSAFIGRHLKPHSRALIVDPGRGNYKKFKRDMGDLGFSCADTLVQLPKSHKSSCHILDFQRDISPQIEA